MRTFSISTDIIPIGEFKQKISKWFKSVQETGQPLVITQNGRPAGVLLSPEEYDELVYQKSFLDSVQRGINDIEKGNIYTTEQVLQKLVKDRPKD
jgi:antitoxin YefM